MNETPYDRAVIDAMRGDLRKLNNKRRRDIAHRYLDALRAVQEETGYGGIEDALIWSSDIVKGRGE